MAWKGIQAADGFNLLHGDLGETDVPNLPFALEREKRADLVLQRHLWIDPVKLEELDAIELQADETALAAFAQIFGPSVRLPLIGLRPLESDFRGDDQILRVGCKASAISFSETNGP